MLLGYSTDDNIKSKMNTPLSVFLEFIEQGPVTRSLTLSLQTWNRQTGVPVGEMVFGKDELMLRDLSSFLCNKETHRVSYPLRIESVLSVIHTRPT